MRPVQSTGESGANQRIDVRPRVDVVDHRADGFIEFRFSLGDPSLYAEMMMRQPEFDEFCRINNITVDDTTT